ncbi:MULTISPECIES: hypothetical protein [Streptomyces]|uniref:hypothetical protein n=1 Tax=Streptomyces TaxID=1883 RepID=UPI001F2E707C|nr:hypothetical protein [Streptomyces sp. 9-7]
MAQVCGDLVAAVLVGVQVVLVVREGRQFQAVPVEERAHPVGVGLVEVGHVEVGDCCVAGAGGGRGGYLQCLVVVFGGPGCDLVERQAGRHAVWRPSFIWSGHLVQGRGWAMSGTAARAASWNE